MTLKMVIQTDKHLLWRGKEYEWLSRSDIEIIDISSLYVEHKVCKQCYLLYTEVDNLIKVEAHYNRVLGVPVSDETQYLMLTIIPNQKVNEIIKPTESNSQQTQVFDISSSKQLVLKADNIPLIHTTELKRMNRFRFYVLIHSLRDVPQSNDITRNYYLEYSIFDQKQRVKLDFSCAQLYDKGYYININRMRQFFFFSHSVRKGLSEYIQSTRTLTMYLF